MLLASIVLAVILVLVIKGFSNPFMAFLAFVTAYELQPGELYPPLAFLHIERVLMAYMLVVFIVNKLHLRYPPITRKFLCFYGAIVLSSFFAFWVSNSLLFDFQFFEIAIYHLLLLCILTCEDRIRKYLLVYTGLIAWIGASALYEYHKGNFIVRMNIERAQGLTSAGGDPNTMAITMVATMPLALMLLGKGTPKWMKFYGIAILTIYLVTVIDTGSRMAFLGFLAFLGLVVFQKRRNWKYFPVIALALPLLWPAIPQQYKARYETIETRDQDESYTNRLLSWQGGVKMFLHSPLTGIGPDDYTEANGTLYWPGQPRHWLNAHSLYFQLLGELGILGVLTFFIYLVAVIRMNWQLARRFKEDRLDPIVQQFPSACNSCLYLLLFTGYSSHNGYRATWYTLGAITAALALLKTQATAPQDPAAPHAKRLPAWVPSNKSPHADTVTV
jgi:hypothetical protein